MKKFLSLCIAAAFALSFNAGAQVFNHLALGIGAGTDGLDLELAAPLGSHVDVRAGYGMGFGLIGVRTGGITLPEHPGNPASANANVPLKLGFGMSDARLLFNIYPGKGGFRFTVGAYMGASRFVRGTFTGMPADYNNVGIDVDGYLVKAKNGELAIDLCASGIGSHGFAVKPYVGIGYGRAVPRSIVSFNVDLGVQYQGKPTAWARGEGLTGRVQDVQLTSKQLDGMDKITEDYGRYMTFWPTLSIHVYFKLF